MKLYFKSFLISDPLLPYSIISSEVSIDSITLTWSYNKSATFIDKFELMYQSYVSSIGDTMMIDGSNATTVVTIDNLTSGEPYVFSIRSLTENLTSEMKSVNVTVSK